MYKMSNNIFWMRVFYNTVIIIIHVPSKRWLSGRKLMFVKVCGLMVFVTNCATLCSNVTLTFT